MDRVQRTLLMLLAIWAAEGGTGEQARLLGQASDQSVSVRGRVVVHETGEPLEGAAVLLTPDAGDLDLPGGGTRQTGPTGVFVFPQVPPGLYRLSASMLGYTDLLDTLRVEAGAALEVTLPLSVSPVPLEPIIVVVGRRPVGPLAAFERRRETQRGVFVTREDIEARNTREFTDLLRSLPGIRLVPTDTYGNRVYFRGGCTPDIWVDGIQVGTTTDLDAFLRPEDLEAVEVYRGPELPGEFGSNLCGAVVAWSRRGFTPDAADTQRSLVRQLIFAGSLVLGIIGFRIIS